MEGVIPELPIVRGGGLRWIPPLQLPGVWQMAIDELLLDAAVGEGEAARPVLRLYRWSRPTLSLGHHQRHVEPHWRALARQGRIDLVRRPSGGRAVLHHGDLTYALIWPRPPVSRSQSYHHACHWLQHAFAALGQPLDFGRQAPSVQAASCFTLATGADLVDATGAKRIGSAQLWRRGHLLQHGSIPLAPSPTLWRRLFGSLPPSLPPWPLAGDVLSERLHRSARELWGELVECPLSAAERAAAAGRLARYRLAWDSASAGVTAASPVPTIPRAT